MDVMKKLGLVERIGIDTDRYLDRYFLTPMTPKGQLLLHCFHRGDMDDHPHDHRWDFWTRPSENYVELVMNRDTGLLIPQIVRAGRWTFRPYFHAHIVLGPLRCVNMEHLRRWSREQSAPDQMLKPSSFTVTAPFRTLVWRTPRVRRSWGFWRLPLRDEVLGPALNQMAGQRMWVSHDQYFREQQLSGGVL